MPNALAVSRLINVTSNFQPTAAQAPNLNTCLLLGTSVVIDTVSRMRAYSSLSQVAADFGTAAEEYLAAALWFEQSPQPETLLIGRWAKTAAAGQLIGARVSSANQLMSAWTAIATGSIKFTIDGNAAQNLAALNFGAAGNLNAVAAIITTALAGSAIVTWNATYQRFEVTSATTGAVSTVAFAAATGAGIDISAMMGLRVTSAGAYVAPGLAAETALTAVTLFDSMFSSQWYGLAIPSGVPADHMAVAAYIEAANPPHYYGATSQDPNSLVASDTTDIGYLLANGHFDKTAWQYSSTSPYAIMSYLARMLTTNWNANNSTIALMYKQEPGIVAEGLTPSQADAIAAKHGNVFANFNNNTAIILNGQSASGQFTDSVVGADWLVGAIQTGVFNLLYGATKVPQTDAGNHLIATQIEAAMISAVNNGLLAPGVWTAGGFGQLAQGDFLPKGFYVYAPPIASQPTADRSARKSVSFQVAAKFGGAVHEADVAVNFNA